MSCSKNPATGKVSGVITLNGKPLADAQVVFHSADEKIISPLGGTDSEGKYELFYTDGKSGALPGKYSVTVSTAKSWLDIQETVPKKYLDAKTSGLDYEVKSGKQTINIDLQE